MLKPLVSCILIAICCSCSSFNPINQRAWITYSEESIDTEVIFYKKNKNTGFCMEIDEEEKEIAIGRIKHGNRHGKWKFFTGGNLTKIEIYKKGKMIERRRFNTANMW